MWSRAFLSRERRGPRVPLSSTQEADAVREALTPGLACAAAHAGDLDVLQALVELVRPPHRLRDQPHHAGPRGTQGRLSLGPCSAALGSSRYRECRWPCRAPLPGCTPPLPSPPRPCPAPPQWVTCLCLTQGSDLSQENFNGQTPLHAAARGGHPEVVTMLLQRGVGVSARDEDGLSPLLLAVKGRYLGRVGRTWAQLA